MTEPAAPAPPAVSVLIPVYNEEDSLPPLYQELAAALDPLPGVSWEVVFVDDGSRDRSPQVLRELAEAHPDKVRVLEFRRNYGQTAALDAAMQAARGEVLVPMDADRQNDPADVPRLLREIASGADVVSGWRRRRQDAFLNRRLPSLLANKLIAWLTGVPIHDFGCTLKAYRRSVLSGVRLYGEMHRFIPAYAKWNGAKVVELEVHHRPRTAGKSKYGIQRTFKVLLDLATVTFLQGGYASRPLHVFGGCGLLLVTAAFGLGVLVLAQKLALPVSDPGHVYVHRNPLAALAATLLVMGGGAVALGLLAELQARVYLAIAAGAPYTLAGARNVAELPTPEQSRALPPGLAALAASQPTPPVSPSA